MSKEAMKLALGKIKSARDCHPNAVNTLLFEAEEILEEALEKPDFWEGYVPEPVKPAQQEFVSPGGGYVPAIPAQQALDKKAENARELGLDYEPAQKPVAWVYPEGLEALKAGKPWTAYGTRQEPNNTALYLSPQPDIAPYAWVTFTPYGDEDDVWYENPEGKLIEGWTYKPLYDTTPPAQRTWVGLTDEDIRQCSRDVVAGGSENSVDRFAYAIEAKLKEKNT